MIYLKHPRQKAKQVYCALKVPFNLPTQSVVCHLSRLDLFVRICNCSLPVGASNYNNCNMMHEGLIR